MKWFLGLLAAIVLAAGVLVGPRLFSAFALLRAGEQVDVGGREIFLHCEGAGSPTVLLEHGLGSNGHGWQTVQGELAEDNRVCWTSRAGVGFSDPAPGTATRTAQDAVDDLRVVITSAGLDEPFVLVGHSFGGFVVRLYAEQHPDDVAGMVLVDATHDRQASLLRNRLSPESWREVEPLYAGENPERMDLLASAEQVATLGDLDALPLVVLEAPAQLSGDAAGLDEDVASEVDAVMSSLWPELQQDLARMSPEGSHRAVADTGHFIHEDRPDAVVDAIRDVLSAR